MLHIVRDPYMYYLENAERFCSAHRGTDYASVLTSLSILIMHFTREEGF